MRRRSSVVAVLLVAVAVLVTGCAEHTASSTPTSAPPPPAPPGADATTTTSIDVLIPGEHTPTSLTDIEFEDIGHHPSRFVAVATWGLHVGGTGQDHVDRYLTIPAEGTISNGSTWDGLPYYRVAGYDHTTPTIRTTKGSATIRTGASGFDQVQPGDTVRAEAVPSGTKVAKVLSDREAVLDTAATRTGEIEAEVRWPALMGSRLPYDVHGVMRLTNQGDPSVNGTFEIFSDDNGVEGIYAVRAVSWNGLHSDAYWALRTQSLLPFAIGGSGEHAQELWFMGDGMDSDSQPVLVASENVKVDPSGLATTDAQDAGTALADLDDAVTTVDANQDATGGALGVLALVVVLVVLWAWWGRRRTTRRLGALEQELADLRAGSA